MQVGNFSESERRSGNWAERSADKEKGWGLLTWRRGRAAKWNQDEGEKEWLMHYMVTLVL